MLGFDERLARVEQSATLEDLEREFLALTAEWDVTSFSISFVSRDNPIRNWVFTSGSWPQELIDEYLARNLTNHDPVVARMTERVSPFTYLEAWAGIEPDIHQQAIVDLHKKYNIVNAIIVPIRLSGALNVATLLTNTTEISNTDRRRIQLRTLTVANVAAFLFGQTPMPRSADDLNERDREVLRWISMGRSSQDVAQILNISESGVNKRLSQLQEMLGAKNRTEAVAIAIRKGLIEF